MAQHVLDIPVFRVLFPAYANATTYPDGVLDVFWGSAVAYLGDYDGCLLRGAALQSALNYMTAHLLALNDMIARGQTFAIVTGSTVDKVSVTREPPPAKSGWQWWLALTPYGLQLWALLSVKSAGGFYVGGRPEQAAFRKVGGRF